MTLLSLCFKRMAEQEQLPPMLHQLLPNPYRKYRPPPHTHSCQNSTPLRSLVTVIKGSQKALCFGSARCFRLVVLCLGVQRCFVGSHVQTECRSCPPVLFVMGIISGVLFFVRRGTKTQSGICHKKRFTGPKPSNGPILVLISDEILRLYQHIVVSGNMFSGSLFQKAPEDTFFPTLAVLCILMHLNCISFGQRTDTGGAVASGLAHSRLRECKPLTITQR